MRRYIDCIEGIDVLPVLNSPDEVYP